MIKIRTIGGYNEVGKNATAIIVDDEVVIMDLGLHLENYIRYTEDDNRDDFTDFELIQAGAVPDVNKIEDIIPNVKAIVTTHAHLDHLGAIPFLGHKFNCPIISTPYSMAVLRSMLADKKRELSNELITIKVNSTYRISEKLVIEFINITHSTPDSSMAVLHTPYGAIVYANDFKIDENPTLGEKTNLVRLKEIRNREGISCLILDSLYADNDEKTPSESEAKDMLKKVLLDSSHKGKAIIVSTFSSHIARLKAIVEMGNKIGRKVIFLGRSLSRYVEAAEEIGLVDFSNVEIVKFGKQIKKRFKQLSYEKEDYIIVCTGHQGERRAVLSRLAFKDIDFKFDDGDMVVFSCTVIPTKINENNREVLESKLKERSISIYKDVHVSGHGSRKDMKEIIEILKPKILIPAHSERKKEEALADLAISLGYVKEESVFVMDNDDEVIIHE